MRLRVGILTVVLGTAAAVAAEPATACVWALNKQTIGKPLSKRAHAERDAAQARAVAKERIERIRDDLRTGRVDAATGLADMLIPNIRAVRIDRSDCGDANEYDTLGGLDRQTSNLFAGTELDGLDPDRFAGFYRQVGDLPGRDCNVEFRARFAAYLRARIDGKSLAQSYVTLANEARIPYFRYYRFAGDRREPPLVTYGDFTTPRARQTALWRVLDPERPIGRSVTAFWDEVGSRVSDDMFACPKAHRDFIDARDAEIARLRARPNYAGLLQQAERGRNNASPNGKRFLPPSSETSK